MLKYADLVFITVPKQLTHIGCGQKVLRKAISWQPPGEYIFCGSIHSIIHAQLPQKVPKQKTCQTRRKWVISDYPLLNCITAKKCEILYSITTKMTCIIRKLTKTYI